MEHINLINRIIEAEQKARQIAEEVRERRESMHSELEHAAADLRGSYLERAKTRIDKVKQREAALAQERLAELDSVFKKDMATIEDAFEQNQDAWVDKLFSMIVRR